MNQRYGTEVWNGSFKEVWNGGMERGYGRVWNGCGPGACSGPPILTCTHILLIPPHDRKAKHRQRFTGQFNPSIFLGGHENTCGMKWGLEIQLSFLSCLSFSTGWCSGPPVQMFGRGSIIQDSRINYSSAG